MIINSQNRKLSNATSTQTKSHVESPLSNLEEIDRPVNFLSFLGTFGQQNYYGVQHYWEYSCFHVNLPCHAILLGREVDYKQLHKACSFLMFLVMFNRFFAKGILCLFYENQGLN